MTGKNFLFISGLGIVVILLGLLYWSTTAEQLGMTQTTDETIDSEQAFNEQLIRDGYRPPTSQPPPLPEADTSVSDGEVPVVATTTLNVRERLASIIQQIEINTSLTASSLSDCRLLPLGNAPCGGPAFYHVYSVRSSNTGALETLAAEHRELASTLNQSEEVMGICAVTPEPTLVLANGQCTAELE
jgi:hypothetical protein